MIHNVIQWIALATDVEKLVKTGSLHLFLFGISIVIFLLILIIIKTNKDIKKLKQEQRKRDKEILKFISNKKNKTY